MTRTTKVATGLGMATSFGGIVTFASAVFDPFGLPALLRLGSLVGGLPVALLGAIVGVRYGNLERYNNHYDGETGKIEGVPIGYVLNPFIRDNGGQVEPPGEFVPSRRLLAAVCFLPSLASLAFLQWAGGFDATLLAVAAVLLLGGSVVAFVVADRVASARHDDYP